ncbi:hypothetical protein PHISP_03919 [Aspergillus sp. HF37]|nr:hypothetical protein PHISP_03919 [Aspergillus sp. HF37]
MFAESNMDVDMETLHRGFNTLLSKKGSHPNVTLDTNIGSSLSAIFIRNMSMLTPESTGEHGDGTVKMDTDTEVDDWALDY